MQTVRRAHNPCLFCTFRLQSSFTTSATSPYLSRRLIDFSERKPQSQKYQREERQPSRYFGQRDRVDQDDRSERPLSNTRHLRFRPVKGEVFDRNHTEEKPRANRPLEITSNSKRLSKGLIKDATFHIRMYLRVLETNLAKEKILKRLGLDDKDLKSRYAAFRQKIEDLIEVEESNDPLLRRLRLAFVERSQSGLEVEVKYAFFGEVVASKFSGTDIRDQERLANLQFPAEWFPLTREFQREFHLHVGPTNSGKTYQALKRLEEAKSGLYAGPLRLLAHEVYMRLNARGQRCHLITGDDRRTPDNSEDEASMVSCTVEMIPLNMPLDVAVIDEIQMIGSEDRGWAWTQAVLGVMAKEVHLCGEARTIPIIKELVAACGEKLHIHHYERLSLLKMAPRSLENKFKLLEKGDCIVCFSVRTIHGLRQALEKSLKCKVAVIYGSLPPETRAAQAKLFNDPDNDYDILVASDAIGMGLNLSIKRIIFAAAHRMTAGKRLVPLSIANVKQIGGRAGRFKTAQQAVDESSVAPDVVAPSANLEATTSASAPKVSGWVTTLEKHDYPLIASAMESEAEPITSAGLFPPAYVVEKFARYFPPGTPFSYLLFRLHELSHTKKRFYLCDLRQQVSIADAIEPVQGLTTSDKMIICSAPIETRKAGESELALSFATALAENKSKSILDFEDVENLNMEWLDDNGPPDSGILAKLERLHKGIIVFLWLSYRFSGIFTERHLAIHVKELVEAKIEKVLSELSFDYDKMRKSQEKAVRDLLTQAAEEDNENDEKSPAYSPDIDPRREELMLDSIDDYGETDDTAETEAAATVTGEADGLDIDFEEVTIQAHERQVALSALYDEVNSSLGALRAIGNDVPLDVGSLGNVQSPSIDVDK